MRQSFFRYRWRVGFHPDREWTAWKPSLQKYQSAKNSGALPAIRLIPDFLCTQCVPWLKIGLWHKLL